MELLTSETTPHPEVKKMEIQDLDMADKDLVILRKGYKLKTFYPYCKVHGAMNTVAVYKNKRKVWRCTSTYGKCRAGCVTSEMPE